MTQRLWVVEGEVDCGFVPVPGAAFTNKRFAWSKLRDMRTRYDKESKFRVTEYVPIERGGK